MVEPELFGEYLPSPLFAFWDEPLVLRALFALLLATLVCFTAGFWARWAQLLALPLLVAFHHANPFIIHEPQQLTHLLIVALLFVPIERVWVVRRSPFLEKLESTSEAYGRGAARLLLAYLGAYYFFAAVKKLPDPAWLGGDALSDLIDWPPLRRNNGWVDFLRAHPAVAALGTWFTLVFELAFAALALTRWRIWLVPVGVLFHLGTTLTLNVGHFPLVMFAWYPLLLADLNPQRAS
jgi:hypothetical protein